MGCNGLKQEQGTSIGIRYLPCVGVNIDSPTPFAQYVCRGLKIGSDRVRVATSIVNSRVVGEQRQLSLFTFGYTAGVQR